MKLRETYRALQRQWRIHRIEAARERLQYLLEVTPRYWSAATIGGGTGLDLGCVTAKEATEAVRQAGHNIVTVDVEGAFIALAGNPSMHGTPADFCP